MGNPFAELSATVSPGLMQFYVVLMIALVVVGVILDMKHKQSAKYFFANAKKAEKNAKRKVSDGEKMSLKVKTLTNEVLTSSEFCNEDRRKSHLLTMYGFIFFVISTAVMIFGYGDAESTPFIWPLLWHLGALSLCVGGYWFWFKIRVDVSAEGLPWNRVERADLFILSLLATATFALLWSLSGATLFFGAFIISSTILFGGVYWSKFAHMFFKPAAAYQKKVTRADESRENLPAEYDLTDPEVQKKFPDIPMYMGDNPPNMGQGIKREDPRHY